MEKRVTVIAGARPNFIKIAPLIHAIQKVQEQGKKIRYRLVHTGQHYDKNMSDTFFEELGIPAPDVNLAVGGGSQAEQTAGIMVAFERELLQNPADLIVVVGDVTSTMACSIVAKKLCKKVAHIEAGIRSWDLTMPEEINRMVTDSITDYFFTTSRIANENLLRAGVKAENIFFVGNIMIDTLMKNRDNLKRPALYDRLDLKEKNYFVLTLHRPSNVDEKNRLKETMDEITTLAAGIPVVFPLHPRTAKMISDLNIHAENLHFVDPLGYLEFNYLVKNSKAVITDSGGITEETTVMGVPCITLRDNTERPETCTIGTNVLAGSDPKALRPIMKKLLDNDWQKGSVPELWDGQTAGRIVDILLDLEF